jgi:hypothetical protein
MSSSPTIDPVQIEDFINVNDRIPKVIHQMWLDKSSSTAPAPDKFHRFIDSIKEKNPDYDYQFWNKDLVRNLFDTFPVLHRWKYFYYHVLTEHIEKCDFARYMIMYVLGGVYIDIDFTGLQGFDTILSDRTVAFCVDWLHAYHLTLHVFEDEPAIFNGFLASAPNQPIWHDLMDFIMNTYRSKKTVMDTTGPIAVGRFFQKYRIYNEYEFPQLFISRCYIIPHGWGIQKVRNGLLEPECDQSKAVVTTGWFDGGDWKLKSVPYFVEFAIEQSHLYIILGIILLSIILLFLWLGSRRREKVCTLNLTTCELKKLQQQQ